MTGFFLVKRKKEMFLFEPESGISFSCEDSWFALGQNVWRNRCPKKEKHEGIEWLKLPNKSL